ncbi:reverse transcriptase domain-containing protein [Tanacetum coccineum]
MFRAVEEMFLGYTINLEGIKPCPDKTEVILQLSSPRTIKEVQILNRKLASLNRFLSKSAEKSLPLFKTLKKCIKKSDFHWMPEAKQAFKQLKQHLSELPLLVAPKLKEELIVYMSASHRAISAVLITERGMRYFQVHPIAVITNQPIKKIMSHPDVVGRLQKWSVMLGEHNITYRPRTSVKGQILADFLVEKPNEGQPDTPMVETLPEGTEFTYSLRFQFTASNNEAEYEALIAGLRIAAQIGVCNVHKKSIQEEEVATVVEEEGPIWMTPIMEYLKDRTLPGDRKEASKLRIKARQYELVEGVLYRRSFLKPWLRNHQQPLTPITALWPFYKWGIDIAGPFPEGPGKVKFLIIAMDYFTKWIEAKAVATITTSKALAVQWTRRKGKLELGMEAVIPAEIGMPMYRTAAVDAVHNDEELRLNLDLLEERNTASHAVGGWKLGPKWKRPYKVKEALEDGAYKPRSTDETVLPSTWNVANLKKCYL